MKIYDEYLKCEVEVQEEITPEIGKEMKIENPTKYNELKEVEQ